MLSWPKERRLSFGSFPDIGIAAAPAKRWAVKHLLAEDKYPTAGKPKRQEPWPSVEMSLSAAATMVRA